MLKFIASAVLASAAIAAALTLLTVTSDAGPLPAPVQETLHTCTQQPWPYLNCVGTPLGNPHIRLIVTERLSA